MKKLLFIAVICMLFTSCTVNADTASAPYGSDDRFIGAWMCEGRWNGACQFLSNGEALLGESVFQWYTEPGNVILIKWAYNNHEADIYKYEFLDNDTLILMQGNRRVECKRTSEHFADLAYD